MKTAGDIVQEKGNELITVAIDATVQDALKVMVAKKVGAVLVEKDGEIVGIWTERDLLRNSILDDFDAHTAKVSDYMTTNVITAQADDNIYRMMDKFLGLRFRHLPIEKEDKIIGLLSSGDVIKAALLDKTKEFDELNEMVSWEYYENWRWSKK